MVYADIICITAKKVNLADVGIVGGLTDGTEEKDKAALASFYMGRAMPMGAGSGFTSMATTTNDNFFSSLSSQSSTTNDNFFSSLSGQQYQYGSFQK